MHTALVTTAPPDRAISLSPLWAPCLLSAARIREVEKQEAIHSCEHCVNFLHTYSVQHAHMHAQQGQQATLRPSLTSPSTHYDEEEVAHDVALTRHLTL
eukprot:scaffold10373_cov44-Tisochrysis_lutea.AAC.1